MPKFANFYLHNQFFQQASIEVLLFINVFITFFNNYIDFANIFSFNLVVQLKKYRRIQNYVIKAIKN